MQELVNQLLDRAGAAEEAHVRVVLSEYATPSITAPFLSPDAADRYGIGLVYQPANHLMWVTQHGGRIGPVFSTKITQAAWTM